MDPRTAANPGTPRQPVAPRTDTTSVAAYFGDVPAAFAPEKGRWRVVAAHHIFGSEELSLHSPAIAQLAPGPYVAMNPADAAGLGLAEGRGVAVNIEGKIWRLPIRVRPEMPLGVAAVPAGVGSLCGLRLPCWASVSLRGKEGRP